jgi:cephalosporin hydroxylase
MTSPLRFIDDTHFELDGHRFEFADPFENVAPSSPEAPFVLKTRRQLDNYVELLAGRSVRNVVELGIDRGGSAIFLDKLLRPQRLVAVDLRAVPPPALERYLETPGHKDVIRAHYGVDQSDKARLAAILDEAFGDEPIDLVIDDASHVYGPTIASFEAIFPRLREGALYIVEDWDALHMLAEGFSKAISDPAHPAHEAFKRRVAATGLQPKPALELGRFAMEATLLAAGTRDLVREVRVRHNWIVLERGAASIERATANLDALAVDRFRVLRPREETVESVFEL